MPFGWGHCHHGGDHSHPVRSVSSQDEVDHSLQLCIDMHGTPDPMRQVDAKPHQQNIPYWK